MSSDRYQQVDALIEPHFGLVSAKSRDNVLLSFTTQVASTRQVSDVFGREGRFTSK